MSELTTLQTNAAMLSALGELKQRRLRREVKEKTNHLAAQKNNRLVLESALSHADLAAQQANEAIEELVHGKAEDLQNLQQQKMQCTEAARQANAAVAEQLVQESQARQALEVATALWVRAQSRDEQLDEKTAREIQLLRKRQAKAAQLEVDDTHAKGGQVNG